jgi:PAS domain S-box-containing protein
MSMHESRLFRMNLGRLFASRAESGDRFKHHIDLSLDLVTEVSYEGYFIYVNRAFTRVLGYPEDELRGRRFLDFVHPDDRAATAAAAAAQTQDGHEIFCFRNRYRTKDGRYRWLEWSSRPDPQSGTLIAIARDITDRVEFEEREQHYQEMLERAVADRTAELKRRNQELQARTHDLELARLDTLRRLAMAAEYRDDATFKHAERVGRLSAWIAQALGQDEEQQELIRLAAPLHDLGKISVPDRVLLKRGPLAADEQAIMRRHTIVGFRLLTGSGSGVLRMAEQIALYHHEHWDGTGYPSGLRGQDIPLCARIVALADLFDVLIHDRPYKEAWPLAKALAEIRNLRGRHLDPDVVDAFFSLDIPTVLLNLDVRQLPAKAPSPRTAA